MNEGPREWYGDLAAKGVRVRCYYVDSSPWNRSHQLSRRIVDWREIANALARKSPFLRASKWVFLGEDIYTLELDLRTLAELHVVGPLWRAACSDCGSRRLLVDRIHQTIALAVPDAESSKWGPND